MWKRLEVLSRQTSGIKALSEEQNHVWREASLAKAVYLTTSYRLSLFTSRVDDRIEKITREISNAYVLRNFMKAIFRGLHVSKPAKDHTRMVYPAWLKGLSQVLSRLVDVIPFGNWNAIGGKATRPKRLWKLGILSECHNMAQCSSVFIFL